MVDVAQLVEHKVVILGVASSILVIHPFWPISDWLGTRLQISYMEGSIPSSVFF